MQVMLVSAKMASKFRSRKEIFICAPQKGQFVFFKKIIKDFPECRFARESKLVLKFLVID
jgi:hypothetical protein